MSRATSVTSHEDFCQYSKLQFCTDPCRKRAGYCKSYTAGYCGCNTVVFFVIHSGKNWSYLPETNQVWLPGPAASVHLLFLRKKKKKKTLLFPWRSSLFPNLSCKIPRSLQKEKRKKKALWQERHRAVRLSLDVRACHTSVFSKVFYIFLKFYQSVSGGCKLQN